MQREGIETVNIQLINTFCGWGVMLQIFREWFATSTGLERMYVRPQTNSKLLKALLPSCRWQSRKLLNYISHLITSSLNDCILHSQVAQQYGVLQNKLFKLFLFLQTVQGSSNHSCSGMYIYLDEVLGLGSCMCDAKSRGGRHDYTIHTLEENRHSRHVAWWVIRSKSTRNENMQARGSIIQSELQLAGVRNWQKIWISNTGMQREPCLGLVSSISENVTKLATPLRNHHRILVLGLNITSATSKWAATQDSLTEMIEWQRTR